MRHLTGKHTQPQPSSWHCVSMLRLRLDNLTAQTTSRSQLKHQAAPGWLHSTPEQIEWVVVTRIFPMIPCMLALQAGHGGGDPCVCRGKSGCERPGAAAEGRPARRGPCQQPVFPPEGRGSKAEVHPHPAGGDTLAACMCLSIHILTHGVVISGIHMKRLHVHDLCDLDNSGKRIMSFLHFKRAHMCSAQALKKSGSDGRFSWQSNSEGTDLSATTGPAAASPGPLFVGIAYPAMLLHQAALLHIMAKFSPQSWSAQACQMIHHSCRFWRWPSCQGEWTQLLWGSCRAHRAGVQQCTG